MEGAKQKWSAWGRWASEKEVTDAQWPLEQTNIHQDQDQEANTHLSPTEQTPIVHQRKTLQRQIESTLTFI